MKLNHGRENTIDFYRIIQMFLESDLLNYKTKHFQFTLCI